MADTEQSQPPRATRKSRRKAAMKVREEIPDFPKDDDEKDGNKDANKETQKSDSPPRNTNSPDPNCAICLCRLENKSFTDSCFHMFCFVCLLEWSKIKAECPLCKQPFKSIIHNVRSYDDYDQYHLERSENPFSFEAPNGRRFRYRTTVTQDYVFGVRPSRHASRAPSISSRQMTSTSEYRRRIYVNGMKVVGLRDSCRRSRNIAPVFFTSNPAASHRLVPWLNRELNALLYNHEEHVQFVLELIIDLIKRFPIQSEDFYQHVYPFVGRHTRHFMHEFEAFAKSPFCISSYDQRAVYEQQTESVSDSDSSPSDNGNDSDVMIVSPSEAPPDTSRRLRRDPGAVRQHDLPPDLTSYSMSLRDLLEENDHGPSQSSWDSPIAGPSWHLASLPSSTFQLPGTSTQLGFRSTEQKKPVRAGAEENNESNAEMVWSDSDSADEVLCVGYDKPWQERTPVLVSTDSEEEKTAKRAMKTKDTIKKEVDSKKSRKRSRSRSRHQRRRGSSSSQSSRRRSRSRSWNRHQRSRYSNRSKSPTRHDHRRSPSPSGSRHRRYHRSVGYEDAFGYSRRTILSPDRNTMDSRGSRHTEGRNRRRKEHHNYSKNSFSSSRSCSRSPSRSHHRGRVSTKDSRTRRTSRARSSSSEIISRHKHKKNKKHRRSRDSEKERRNSDNVQYKIVKGDKKGDKKGDPLMSITIKRDKTEDAHIVSSTVDSTASAANEIGIPDNLVIRTEPVSPRLRESTASSDKSRSPKTSKSSVPSGKNSENSDSSGGRREIRKKSFKKHPSGHKKTRRPLPRIPDPLPSAVGNGGTPPRPMPVLDVMSQFFPHFGNATTCTTAASQDYPIPGMMANFFDSRHFYLFPGSCLSNFPSAVPPQPSSSRVTSSDQAVVVSSSDDSDVVVESVKNSSGNAVSSSMLDPGLSQLHHLDFLDRIPILADSIGDHISIDISEEINVEDSDSDTIVGIDSSGQLHMVTEVLDSDDDNDNPSKHRHNKSHVQSGEHRVLSPDGGPRAHQSPSSTVQGAESVPVDKGAESVLVDKGAESVLVDTGAESVLVDKGAANTPVEKEESRGREEETKQPESPPTSSPISSTRDQGETSRETDVEDGEATTDDSMDIDVGGPEMCGQAINLTGRHGESSGLSDGGSEEMEIDVVGSDEAGNESPLTEEPLGSRVNGATSGALQQGTQSKLASSIAILDNIQGRQHSPPGDLTSDVNLNNNATGCVRGIASTPASPCEAGAESSLEHEGRSSASDLRENSPGCDRTPKPTSFESADILVPLIEGASEISSEDDDDDVRDESTPISQDPRLVIAGVTDISSEESDYDDLNPLYSNTNPQVIDDDSESSDITAFSSRHAALQTTISISDVSSDEASEEADSASEDSELSRSGNSEHEQAASSPPSSRDTSPTVNSIRSPSKDTPSNGDDDGTRSSGELSSGEITDDSSDDQKVYDDISSSENFDSSSVGESSPVHDIRRRPPSDSATAQICSHDGSLSEGEIVSD